MNNIVNALPELRIKKLSLYLFLLLVFPAFLDLVNGFLIQSGIVQSVFTLGVLFRGLLILIIFPYVFTRKSSLNVYILLMISVWFVSNLFWMTWGDYYRPYFEVYTFAKILFPFLLLTLYLRLDLRYHIDKNQILSLVGWWGFFAGISIVLAYVFKFGYLSYGKYNYYGVKAFFKAQNDVSLGLIISLPLVILHFVKFRKFMTLIHLGIITAGALLIGTRAGIVGTALVYFFILIGSLFLRDTKVISFCSIKVKNIKAFFVLLLIVMSVAVFIHEKVIEDPFFMAKFDSLTKTTPRESFEKVAFERMKERNILLNIVGEGNQSFGYNMARKLDRQLTKYGGKGVEADLYDIFGAYGILLTTLIFGLILFFHLKSIGLLFKRRNFTSFSLFLVMSLFLGHSLLAGHAITSTIVGTLMAPVYFLILKEKDLNTKGKVKL